MDLHAITATVTDFIRIHSNWASPIVFLLAFAESLIFLSLFVPATMILLAIGVLIGEANIPFIPIWIAASLGAFLGEGCSFYLGYHFKDKIVHLWPLKNHPKLVARGHVIFKRWGILAVFFGRFFGPLRAVLPLIAGICEMPIYYFQSINFVSSFIWGFVMLAPGALGLKWIINYFWF